MTTSWGRRVLVLSVSLLLNAIAPVIASAAPPLSVYGSLPGFEIAALSDSGEYVALVGVVNDKRQLIVMDKDAKPVVTAPLGDLKIRGLYWAGDESVLVYKSDSYALNQNQLNSQGYFTAPKTEVFSMIVVPLNGQEPWRVFANRKNITGGVRGFYGVRERGGHYYGYFGGITYEGGITQNPYLTTTAPVLYEVDLQDQSAKKVAARFSDHDAGQGYRDWMIGANGEISATLDYFSSDGSWTIRNSANDKIASGTNNLGHIRLVGFGSNNNSLVYSEVDEEDGKPQWYEMPLSGGTATPFHPEMPPSNVITDSRTAQILGYFQGGESPYVFFNPNRQKVANAMLKAFPNVTVKLKYWNRQFTKLLVMTEGINDPQTWWKVDIKTGQATELGVSYALRTRDVAPMRMVQYKAQDGLDIAAVLTLPADVPAKNLPVVVLPHGGPAAHDDAGFDWWAQAFASRGYAVLQPNFRGSSGYGAAFEQAGHGEWGRKMQTDISDGLAYLAGEGIVNPKRACIVGASYGGYAALAGVTLQKGKYLCAVSVAGISNLEQHATTLLEQSQDDAGLRRSLQYELGSGKDLRAVSPVNFAASADAPILLIHGKDDIVVRYAQSDNMATALRKAGKPVEFVTLQGEDHWLSRSATRLAMLEAAVAFVEKHNPVSPKK